MKKIIGVIILSIVFSTGVAHAGPLSGLQDQIDTINGKMNDMQSQIDSLKGLNTSLQNQINAQKQTVTIQPVTDVTSQIALTNTRVDAVEKRMSTLETAISYIQKNVMDALNTTIGLLKQILKLK